MGPLAGDGAGAACAPSAPLRRPIDPATASDYAHIFKALADETRLQIVRLLAEQPVPLCVCHIEAAFGLTQSGTSYHLRVLREAGLVTARRCGTWVYYQLVPQRLAVLGRLAVGRPETD